MSDSVITEEEDKRKKEAHIAEALKKCGYPEWSMKRVKEKMKESKNRNNTRKRRDNSERSVGLAVIPYIKGVS